MQGVDEEPEHVVTVVLRSAQKLELVCPSAGVAATWLQGIKSAISSSRGGVVPSALAAQAAAVTGAYPAAQAGAYPAAAERGARSGSGLPPRVPVAAVGGRSAPDRGQGTGTAGSNASSAPAVVPVPVVTAAASAAVTEGSSNSERPKASGVGVDAAAARPAAARQEDECGHDGDGDAGEVVAPPTKGSFLDFSIDEATEPEPRPGAEGNDNATCLNDSVVIETPAILQASDFGFGDDASDSSSEASDAILPTVGGVASNTIAPAAGDGDVVSASAEAERESSATVVAPPPASAATGAAEDKHVGLSMQQRLAALEFSDDEDDDDDPLGLKTKTADAE